MVWSRIDFEKEVRRQLIELRSLRKRVPADGEILERIERLEASHHGLLRKLGDLFRVAAAPEATPQVRARKAAGSGNCGAAAWTLPAGVGSWKVIPNCGESCAACGRRLVGTGAMGGAGGAAVKGEGGWYHATCLDIDHPASGSCSTPRE